jgi:hypothetical protein
VSKLIIALTTVAAAVALSACGGSSSSSSVPKSSVPTSSVPVTAVTLSSGAKVHFGSAGHYVVDVAEASPLEAQLCGPGPANLELVAALVKLGAPSGQTLAVYMFLPGAPKMSICGVAIP